MRLFSLGTNGLCVCACMSVCECEGETYSSGILPFNPPKHVQMDVKMAENRLL